MKRFKDQVPYEIDTPKDLIDSLQQGSKDENFFLSEFYLHNVVTPHPYKWSPNPYVRDVKLRTLNSWTTHENERANELIKYEVVSKQSELYIIGEYARPSKVILSHTTLLANPDITPILINKQEKVILRFQ